MIKENFYTGEPIMNSPPQSNNQFISESEAAQNASFGQYINQNQYGYGNPYFNQNFYNNQYNQQPYGQPYGLGGNFYQWQYNQNNTPFMNPPQYGGYNNYGYGNPAFNPYYNQQNPYEPQQIFIPPVNYSGNEYLPPSNYEDIIDKMRNDYIEADYSRRGEDLAKKSNQQNNMYFGNMNYFGIPFYSYQNDYNSQLYRDIENLKNQARNARKELSINLSKLCHNYLNDGVSDEQIEEMYNGKVIDIESSPYTAALMIQARDQERFQNLVPFNNAAYYCEMDNKVSEEFNKIVPKDSNMVEAFDKFGIIYAEYLMEEEKSRRRDFSEYSSGDVYKYMIMKKAAENQLNRNGYINRELTREERTQIVKDKLAESGFPILSDSAYIDDDGDITLSINMNNAINNSEESKYNNKRNEFIDFLNSVPNSNTKNLVEKKEKSLESYDNFQYHITHPDVKGGG